MKQVDADPATLAAFVVVMVCWLAFGLTFLFRLFKRSPGTPETRKSGVSSLGIALQSVAYFLVWLFRRPLYPIVAMPLAADIAVSALAVIFAVGSIWLVQVALRVLGRQWAFRARLVEGHKLVTEGPYSLVRNPIYTGMFGMLLATGLVATRWPAFIVAIVIFLIGTVIRVRSEEHLLREQFGADFDAYANRVRAFIPGIY
jgi:protein-S-isoprenylcysteine O-methyltransferase Ste14